MNLSAVAGGAGFGIGVAGLLAAHLRSTEPVLFLAGALLGALAAGLRAGPAAPGQALAGAAAGLLGAIAPSQPEPTFFALLVLVAAGVSWPLRAASSDAPLPPWALPASFLAGAAVFFVQSANRLWGFGAGSKDLGLFYQTHWLIAHGLPPLNTVMGLHALADHMEFLDWPVALLLHVHEGPETLLFVQAVSSASAVFPLGWLGRRLIGPRAGLALAWAWLLAPDLHLGVMFDYNPTLPGSAALLWTAWALVCRGLPASLAAALVASLSKENACLYVALVSAVLALRVAPWRRCAAVAALALALFAAEMALVFPHFREGGFRHWEFEDLGRTPAETAAAAVRRPWDVVRLALDHPQKRRSLLQPLAATGFLALADPPALLLQAPNVAERLLSTHRTRWWGYHYGVPAAATACLGALLGLHRLGSRAGGAPAYLLASAALCGLLAPYRTPLGNLGSDLYRLRQPYVSPPDEVATQRAAVAFVGRSPYLKVAAQDRLLPYLAGRRDIYMLERAAEADVIALHAGGSSWPYGPVDHRRRLRQLRESGAFGVAFCEGKSVVLRRGLTGGLPCPAWDDLTAER